eukprot:symbB.v1.2.015222.t2/scaffold1115.1/size137032/7
MTTWIDKKGGEASALEAAKRVWAGLLRSVLRGASKQLRVDRNTILFLQGDLNSRTLLEGRGKDLLLEVLKDLPLQRAIQRGMDLPNGRWYEVALSESEKDAQLLPVTYKFKPNASTSSLRIGDVMEEASKARLFPNAMGRGTHSPRKYRETLIDAEDACGRWGLAFQKSSFRPFRFPACADRMIFWAPNALAPRLSWETHGYSVNYEQQGSDHKPVWLDLLLHIAPPSDISDVEMIDEDVAAEDVASLLDSVTERGTGTNGTSRSAWWPRRPAKGWNWTPDTDAADCEICDVPFSLLRRRHHCRYCGRCICDTCSPVECWRILPELDSLSPSRFCIECSGTQSVTDDPTAGHTMCCEKKQAHNQQPGNECKEVEVSASEMREKLKAAALWKSMPVKLLQEECHDLGLSFDFSASASDCLTAFFAQVLPLGDGPGACLEGPIATMLQARRQRWLCVVLLTCSQVSWVAPFSRQSCELWRSALRDSVRRRSDRHQRHLAGDDGELLFGGPRPGVGWSQATMFLLLVGLAAPVSALAPSSEFPDGNPVANDLRLPPLPQDEMQRRRTAPKDILKNEKWYKQGKRAFESNCAGCHPLSRLVNERNQDQLLTKEYFGKRGGLDEARIQYNIRYGAGNMPGYAADCGDLNDNFAATCSTIVPLSEEKLRDVQDYLLNRMNTDDWQSAP